MNGIVDIEVLPLQTEREALSWRFDCHDCPDYPRWFRYQGQLYSLNFMFRCHVPCWDFDTFTSVSNGTVYAAVLDERTVRVGRVPPVADDN